MLDLEVFLSDYDTFLEKVFENCSTVLLERYKSVCIFFGKTGFLGGEYREDLITNF